MSKNRWNTPNSISVKDTVINMLKEGKSKEEIIDIFYKAGNIGYFLWRPSSKESIENSVDEIIETYNQSKKVGFFSKLFKFYKRYKDLLNKNVKKLKVRYNKS